MKTLIIGAGKVGRALAQALRKSSHSVTLRPARKGIPRSRIDAALVVLAVRDADLASLARELANADVLSRRNAVVHVAGALGPEVLAPLAHVCGGVGQMHPMVSIAEGRRAPALRGAHLLVTGDELARRRCRTMARALKMVAHERRKVDRPLYHAAGSLRCQRSCGPHGCGS